MYPGTELDSSKSFDFLIEDNINILQHDIHCATYSISKVAVLLVR